MPHEELTPEQIDAAHLTTVRGFWERVDARGENPTYDANGKVINRGHPQFGDIVQELNGRSLQYTLMYPKRMSLEEVARHTLDDFAFMLSQNPLADLKSGRRIVMRKCNKERVQDGLEFIFGYEA